MRRSLSRSADTERESRAKAQGEEIVKKHAWLLLGLAAMAAVPAMLLAQRPEYPIVLVAPGKGPYTFPDGYQTPWDRIEIMVTVKMSPNLFVLHGSEAL